MRRMKRDLARIQDELDDVLTADDLKALREAREDVRTGKAVRLAQYRT